MLKSLSTILLIVLAQQCSDISTQNNPSNKSEEGITPIPFTELPKKLDESSGLEVVDRMIYSMNDSGGKPELFAFDASGNSQGRIKIKHAKNHDWESVAANATHFFIGDLGNNSGNRDNLAIYYFPNEDLEKDKIKADKIKFKYANQTNYANKKKQHSFDGEALIALEDRLVIFSKDWLENTTQVYHLPLEAKDEVVMISPSEKLAIDALITGADYDADNKLLVLSGYKNNYNYIWIFTNSTPQKFLNEDYRRFDLNGLYGAQVEGIAFLNQNEILISTEETKKFKPQIWKLDLYEIQNVNN